MTQVRTPGLPRLVRSNGQDRKLVSMAAIRQLANQIANKFHPDAILLVGSYAYGRPRPDSDVDLLIVMSATDENRQADRIESFIRTPYLLQVHFRTPDNLRFGLEEGNWFLCELVARGRLLYGRLPAWTRWAKIWFDKGHALANHRNGYLRLESPMKKATAEGAEKAKSDWLAANTLGAANVAAYDNACFHCQQAVEKYFKALLQQAGLPVAALTT
jgi:uncharacterized protein